MKRRGKSRGATRRKGTFDPDDTTRVKHTRVGVWDLYEEITPELQNIPGASNYERFLEWKRDLPYVWLMLKDISSIRRCWPLFFSYFCVEFALALMPAMNLWFKGQLLTIVQRAVETRTVDKNLLMQITLGVILCKLIMRLLRWVKLKLQWPLSSSLKQHFTTHLFEARARLDVPTFENEAIQAQLEAASTGGGHFSIAWGTFTMLLGVFTTAVQLISQVSVLWHTLSSQMDGHLLAAVGLFQSLAEVVQWKSRGRLRDGVWAATTKNHDYIKLQGLKRLVAFSEHRKEFVAGNMAQYTLALFKHLATKVGPNVGEFWEVYENLILHGSPISVTWIFNAALGELPQIVFALRAVQYPSSIPVSLTTLHLVSQSVNTFSHSVWRLIEQTGSIADQIASVRKLYDVMKIPNQVVDGTIPFPEDEQKIRHGVSLEFRHVSFKYPGSEEFALHDISFKLKQGQLCVIVGDNGSGKSTILKLIVRLHDPTEGEIFVDGKDIRTLKLADLRQAISVLFQDYTHFPLTIRDNIALGDPQHAEDEDRIRLAARLGGSEDFINKLPDGFDTYLDRPVKDLYGGLPEGTKTLFGRSVDYSAVRGAGEMSSKTHGLSGGQMQRLAVSRTFMRSVVSDDSRVGLLLFDEPSASLDPIAEHDLFARLRELRGNKTMLFSSHRFGNLTRHADLILYMRSSHIIETGTHDELLKHQGDYARIWNLQAQAFL
ncbi:hypothetical protein QCA50_008535 [Cerrena zonata]|uniref:ABC transporter domain-containing protein n=1 Tax=Cerrena zonata TaxID=2478898 RepID=A0AAW0GGM7_9APHY